MKLTKDRVFVLSGQAGMVVMLVGLIIARWVAPPRPSETAAQIARMYQVHTDAIRVGIVLCLFGAALLGPFIAMISVHLRRIDVRSPASSYCQMTLGGLLVLELIIPLMVLATAAFRPDRPASEIQLLNDMGWLMLVAVVSTAVVEMVVIGFAVLADRHRHQVFAPWAAPFNFVCALVLIPGALSIYFTSGPFGWDGAVAYWIPFAVFGLWMGGMTMLLLRAVDGYERELEAGAEAARIVDLDAVGLDAMGEVGRLSAELAALQSQVTVLAEAATRAR